MSHTIHRSIIRDPVHGDIEVPPDIREIIDTSTFQRLRYIQQLATCHYAFPGATHTRFAHSIGAFHLANKLVSRLRSIYPNRINDLDAKLVTYGALLHDVGHPPFSHMLEDPDVFATYASHETWGKRLLLSPDCDLYPVLKKLVGKEGVDRLVEIMEDRAELSALHDIVSSQLDVDRLDYLARDKLYTGVDVGGFDITRLFRSIRIDDQGRLAISRDGLPIVEAYLVTRWHMYFLVYFHRITMLTQIYYTRALLRAKQLHLKGALELSTPVYELLLNEQLGPSGYARLTDPPIMTALFEWSSHPDTELSTLATRIISRSNFHRRITGRTLKISVARRLIPEMKTLIEAAGFSPQRDLILARAQKRGYLPYERGILLEDGSDVRDRSRLIKALDHKIDEVMVFVPPSCVDACVALIKQAGEYVI